MDLSNVNTATIITLMGLGGGWVAWLVTLAFRVGGKQSEVVALIKEYSEFKTETNAKFSDASLKFAAVGAELKLIYERQVEFRQEVSGKYATSDDLRQLDQRLFHQIERIIDQLDNITERVADTNTKLASIVHRAM